MDITHARIKYLQDDFIDFVPIEKIKEFKKTKPRHKNDFDKTKVYTSMYTDAKNPEPISLHVQISDLACNLMEIKEIQKKRPIFPPINDSDIPNSSNISENESEDQEQHYSEVQKAQRNKSMSLKRGRKIMSKINKNTGLPRIVDSDESEIEDFINQLYHSTENNSQRNKETAHPLTGSLTGSPRDRSSTSPSNTRANNNNPINQPTGSLAGFPRDRSPTPSPISPTRSNRSPTPPPISPTRSTRSPTPPDDAEDDINELKEKFVSKFVIESIQYYKAKEGHGFEERNKRYMPTEDGSLYLGEGKTIKPDVWRMMSIDKPNIFYRELLTKLWTPRDLANRALQVEKVTKTIDNRSPVKKIQSNLLRLSISLFNDFLDKQRSYSPEDKANFLKMTRNILSQKIRDLRMMERRRARGSNECRKRLRYD